MKRFFLSLTVLAVILGAMTLTPTMALAAHPHPGPHVIHGGPGPHFSHYLHHDYHGWSRTYWNARYGCNFYLCPTDGLYYYYYAPSACYLPISDIATYPPVAIPAPVAPGPVVPMPMPAYPGY